MLYTEFNKFMKFPESHNHFAIVDNFETYEYDNNDNDADELFVHLNDLENKNCGYITQFYFDSGFLLCFKNSEDLSFYKIKYADIVDTASTEEAVDFVIENLIEDDDIVLITDCILTGNFLKQACLHMLWYKDADELFLKLKTYGVVTGKLIDYRKK